MKLQDQVCTEQQADRLKELGVVQESLFYHTHSDWGVMPKKSIDFSGDPSSAFTVAELGVMMPVGYDTMANTEGYNSVVWRGYDIDGRDCPKEHFDTEAQCRAAMIISLLESFLITPAEANERLK
jgi:hypothetical protein